MQAIGYVRRSTDRQDESLDQQRGKLEEFARSKGWTLAHVYEDDAISGSDLGRPGLTAMIERAERDGDVSAILVWDRNRLARPKDPVDGLLLERRLLSAGKRMVYVATGTELDRSFATGLLSYIENYQNGDYLRKLSRDTIRGVVARVERGLWPGGPIPFGFDRLILGPDGDPKRIIRDLEDRSQAVIDPATWSVMERIAPGHRYAKQEAEACTLLPSDPGRVRAVHRLFADYAAGKPTRRLRDELNAAGFRTSRGSMFTVQTILPMLANPAYLGRCVYNRRTLSKWHTYRDGRSVERHGEGVEHRPASDWVVRENAWAALVDQDVFDVVQKRRDESKGRHRSCSGRAVRAGYLLTGLISCGRCGASLVGVTQTSGKGYRTRYYACGAHHRGRKDLCPTRYAVPADFLEGHISGLIRDDLMRLRDDDALHRHVADELRRVRGGREDTAGQIQRRLATVDQQLARLREHIKAMDRQGAEALGLYAEASALGTERQALESELGTIGAFRVELPDPATIRRLAGECFDRLDEVLSGGTIEERRDFVRSAVKTIKADPDTRTVRIGLLPALFNRKIVLWQPSSRGVQALSETRPGGPPLDGSSARARGYPLFVSPTLPLLAPKVKLDWVNWVSTGEPLLLEKLDPLDLLPLELPLLLELLPDVWVRIDGPKVLCVHAPSARKVFVPGTHSATVRTRPAIRSMVTIGSSARPSPVPPGWRVIRMSPTRSSSAAQKPHASWPSCSRRMRNGCSNVALIRPLRR